MNVLEINTDENNRITYEHYLCAHQETFRESCFKEPVAIWYNKVSAMSKISMRKFNSGRVGYFEGIKCKNSLS